MHLGTEREGRARCVYVCWFDWRYFFLTLKTTQVCIVANVTSDYQLMAVEEMVAGEDHDTAVT